MALKNSGPSTKSSLDRTEIQTVLDYPPMQQGASFKFDAVKAAMAKRMQQAEAASKGPGN